MRIVLLSLIAIGGLVLLGVAASFYAWQMPCDYAQTTIVIPPHSGARGAMAQLHAAHLVPPLPMIALPMVLAGQTNLKAGEYAFAAGMSPAEIIGKIARGEIVIHKVTIPEGWNSFQVRAALLAEPLLTGDVPPFAEGSVVTDTMRFTRGETRSAVLQRMQQAQSNLIAQLWTGRDAQLPLSTPEQAVVLASVVEKETGVPEERAKVAQVFYNRIKLGMKLQSDPTVAYGIEVRQGGAPLGRPLSKADLMTDTPYNSYTRDGLPPTPICNPGRAAIEAVLHPVPTDALYFVATGHGGHNFAVSLDDHTQNVVHYRKAIQPVAAQKKN